MRNKKFAIVVVAYNRVASLQRLIGSILSADFCNDWVDLVVSIDNSGSNLVFDYAKSILWPHGDIRVIHHKERLGLKRHVISCGNLTSEYENICVFEDDLYVSPEFYKFSKIATENYINIDCVAGISLYGYQWNQYANEPFNPIEDGYDAYFLQVASSWGQVWNEKKWTEFMSWLDNVANKEIDLTGLPSAVWKWSEKSWLKYHNLYLVRTGKYFIYPKISLTTNFSDNGEHAKANNTYQVSFLMKEKKYYALPLFPSEGTFYDAFFENSDIYKNVNLNDKDLDVSFYGNKPSTKRYILTTKVLKYKILKSYGMKVRPIDANVVLNIPGEDIFLYDTSVAEENIKGSIFEGCKKIVFNMKTESRSDLLKAAMYITFKKYMQKFK